MKNMEGKEYWHGKYGTVQVIKQPNYKADGPRNVLIRTKADGYYVVPQRSLRKKWKNHPNCGGFWMIEDHESATGICKIERSRK